MFSELIFCSRKVIKFIGIKNIVISRRYERGINNKDARRIWCGRAS